MIEQIVFYWVLKVKHDNDLLIKETHQIHSETGKIFTCLWIYDVIVDAGLLIPDLNFPGLDDVFAVVEFGGKGGIVFLPVCPIPDIFEIGEGIKKELLVLRPQGVGSLRQLCHTVQGMLVWFHHQIDSHTLGLLLPYR